MNTTMNTCLITIEFALPLQAGEIPGAIETELRKWGEPLRWAITAIENGTRLAQIEAIVTKTFTP